MWIVEVIDPGCDCCSYLPIAEFATEKEAQEFVGDDKNLKIYEDEDEDEQE